MTAVRDDAAASAQQLAEALVALSLPPRATVVNRALPETLPAELGALTLAELGPEAAGVVRYALAYAAVQRRVITAAAALSAQVIVLPASRGLDESDRLDTLTTLGERLRAALAAGA